MASKINTVGSSTEKHTESASRANKTEDPPKNCVLMNSQLAYANSFKDDNDDNDDGINNVIIISVGQSTPMGKMYRLENNPGIVNFAYSGNKYDEFNSKFGFRRKWRSYGIIDSERHIEIKNCLWADAFEQLTDGQRVWEESITYNPDRNQICIPYDNNPKVSKIRVDFFDCAKKEWISMLGTKPKSTIGWTSYKQQIKPWIKDDNGALISTNENRNIGLLATTFNITITDSDVDSYAKDAYENLDPNIVTLVKSMINLTKGKYTIIRTRASNIRTESDAKQEHLAELFKTAIKQRMSELRLSNDAMFDAKSAILKNPTFNAPPLLISDIVGGKGGSNTRKSKNRNARTKRRHVKRSSRKQKAPSNRRTTKK